MHATSTTCADYFDSYVDLVYVLTNSMSYFGLGQLAYEEVPTDFKIPELVHHSVHDLALCMGYDPPEFKDF